MNTPFLRHLVCHPFIFTTNEEVVGVPCFPAPRGLLWRVISVNQVGGD